MTLALLSMVSLLGVAAIGAFAQVWSTRMNVRREHEHAEVDITDLRSMAELMQEHVVWERWFNNNNFDHAKIRTGHESEDEVRRATT